MPLAVAGGRGESRTFLLKIHPVNPKTLIFARHYPAESPGVGGEGATFTERAFTYARLRLLVNFANLPNCQQVRQWVNVHDGCIISCGVRVRPEHAFSPGISYPTAWAFCIVRLDS